MDGKTSATSIEEEARPDRLECSAYWAFAGCGMRGVTYLGVLRAVQRAEPGWYARVRGAAGSSSGCIAALAMCVNADADALIARWRELNVTSVLDLSSGSISANLGNVFSRLGLNSGDALRRIISVVLDACGLAATTTFAMLHRLTGRDFRVCVTNISRLRLEVFAFETTPDVPLAEAMYHSMCVPFAFEPRTYRGDVMVDGCCLAYVPVGFDGLFPPEQTTTVYCHAVRQSGERQDVTDVSAFATRLLGCCSLSVLQRADEMRRAAPQRFLHFAAGDAVNPLSCEPAAFERLVEQGYGTTLARLYPQGSAVVPLVVRTLAQLAQSGLSAHTP